MMNKKDKKIIQEDIKDLQNLIIMYKKNNEFNKASECEKEIERLKKEAKIWD